MPEPLALPSYEDLDELVDTNPIRLRDEAFTMRCEVERLRAELADLQGQNALTESHFASHVADSIREAGQLTKRAEGAEVDRDRLRALYQDARDRCNEAEEKVFKVALCRAWTNEDGKSFVFAEDLREALGRPAGEAVTG